MSDSRIIIPGAGPGLSKPPTFTRHNIGGIPVDVCDDAPPTTIQPLPVGQVQQAVSLNLVQVAAIMRELVSLRERVAELERDSDAGLLAEIDHNHGFDDG